MAHATRKTLAVRQSEASLHLEVVRFLRVAWPSDLIFAHVPNGGLRNRAEAGKLKAMGVLAGVSDLLFVLPQAKLGAIELKTTTGALTPEQIAFGEKLAALGGGFAVCRSVDDVERTLNGWLAKFGRSLRARSLPTGETEATA